METGQDSSSLLRNLLAHLKHEVQLYGAAVPTPCKPFAPHPQPTKQADTPDGQPQPSAQQHDDAEAEALNNNNNNVDLRDAPPATILGKVAAIAKPADSIMSSQAKTPWSARPHESPMQVEQFTGMARASLIDDLSDSSWSRCTPKKLVYSDSPCKVADSPAASFSFDVAGCCNMLDSVGLEHATAPTTPYIGAKPESPMDTSPTPAKCSVQELQELSNMLIQERAEKLALAAFNQQLMEELSEMKKLGLGPRS